jgi:hypothetical protein
MLQSDTHITLRASSWAEERVSIQAAVMLAERWTTLTVEDISRF